MNFFVSYTLGINFLLSLSLRVILIRLVRAKLEALNNSQNSALLYRSLQNEDAPPDSDPAKSIARIRRKICDDIICNGFFYGTEADVLIVRRMYRRLNHPRFSGVFHLIHSRTNKPNSHYKYTNFYKLLEFNLGDFHFREYVFLCPLIPFESLPEILWSSMLYYVSKEYNVGPFGKQLYMPGRFIFNSEFPGEVILAEEPASAFIEPGFNVELYYLRMRRFVQPVLKNDIDPFCKLIGRFQDPNDHHHRFCTVVARSSYFKTEVEYPEYVPYPCYLREISFRTADGIKEAADKKYYEQMTLCHSTRWDEFDEENFFFISRAYLSNALLVYRRNPSDRKMYLHHLSTNISVVDELDSFSFIEF